MITKIFTAALLLSTVTLAFPSRDRRSDSNIQTSTEVIDIHRTVTPSAEHPIRGESHFHYESSRTVVTGSPEKKEKRSADDQPQGAADDNPTVDESSKSRTSVVQLEKDVVLSEENPLSRKYGSDEKSQQPLSTDKRKRSVLFRRARSPQDPLENEIEGARSSDHDRNKDQTNDDEAAARSDDGKRDEESLSQRGDDDEHFPSERRKDDESHPPERNRNEDEPVERGSTDQGQGNVSDDDIKDEEKSKDDKASKEQEETKSEEPKSEEEPKNEEKPKSEEGQKPSRQPALPRPPQQGGKPVGQPHNEEDCDFVIFFVQIPEHHPRQPTRPRVPATRPFRRLGSQNRWYDNWFGRRRGSPWSW